MSKGKFVVITGPTASGKTIVSVSVAKAFRSQVISADSMQIYQGMDIGTAKASAAEMNGVQHHFIDIISPAEDYSAAQFQQQAFSLIDKMNQNNILPVIAGGTGLYINSLVYDLDFNKSRKNEVIRQKYAALADDKGTGYLYNILNERDPNYANIIAPTDVRRIIRRLEIIDTVGVQPCNFRAHNTHYDVIIIGLTMPRDILYDRINARVDTMMADGLANEVRRVHNRYGNTAALKAIGYKELIAHFEGEYDLDEAVRLIKRNSRRYAKRQLTWFRADERIKWFDVLAHGCIEDTINDIIKYIKGKGF